MTKTLPDLEAWAIFAKVAEHGSFSRAARELGLSDPTVSKAIGRIEARLRVTLIARTSRRVSLTDAGRAALTRATRILAEGEAIEEEAGEHASVPRGRVRVSAPLSFGIGYLGATLPGFLEAYPEIIVDFALSDRKIDLVAEGFDMALRIATLDDSSMLSRRLSTVRLLLVAAPGYVERHGMPRRPSDLAGHRALGYSGSTSRGVWRFRHASLGEETVEPPVCVWSDNVDLTMPALLAGQGLAIMPEFMVWNELRNGRLDMAMPGWSVDPLGLHLVMPASPLRPLRVQVLIDYLARELAHTPWARA
ncbi:LysR family transcriptional regulator [Tanticharoenia sakaeratensis]|uniref:Transcriptional regulator n=1 Tax=Tanticharoenia sakaeratensis NBRC 103193 TaxID=1231623 RepID=A0A0D6MNY9_9PROT|nr:LysR family transcriptional regulator [Tanticharoenia sakaeratensis]GAN55161.1 transcriptional regulator [Tanticharoenia sakaeratensis NBRC 103193]GBQ24941.1 LysR family transcriptional regulator [Tanticharoenia sakaeratensis NBRC 103193]